ncbi:MATE family efflux transporter [Sphingomonas yantingensis]|uniref:Multidrug-efflux transporter n=1 Tax=Sphingomonas yantingensis TaxID=1241761 RepID=A0A7W9AM27_9SPHN|nr:MATE family efflux transporter [Sphingomonas yantingensis]MBB5696965.1 MATE family multidrug resistance protein [Sphingomonas yantingensis]
MQPARSPLSDEARRILALAWPVMLTSLNWTILHLTDVIVVGLTGTHEVAALGASRALTYIGIVVVLGWLSGVIVMVSRADGAGDLRETGRVLHEGLVLGLMLGIASGGILFAFAEPLLRFVGVAPDLAPAAAAVVRVMACAYPFQLLSIAASFFLEGVSRPRRVMVVQLSVLPLNGVLAWVLATGQFGLPAFGAVGAASATAIASAFGAAAMLYAAWTLPRAAERGVRTLTDFRWSGVTALLSFGAVPALASGLELAGFSILIALSTQLGEATAHAFQIVFSVHNVTFGFALGLGSAAGVRVGNAVGEGRPDEAWRRAAIAAGLAALGTGLMALVILIGIGPIVSVFPSAPAVHAIAAAMLLRWAPFILFDGLQVVFVYALRSLGDQVAAGLNGIAAFFVVTGGLGWWLIHVGAGPAGLVWASGAGMVAAALFNGARLWWVSGRANGRLRQPA